MPEKIIISFDDEEEQPPQKPDAEPIPIEKILPIDSYPEGSKNRDKFFRSDFEFPPDKEKSFYIRNSVELKDRFLNSILETSRHIILSSVTGSIYIIDKNTLSVDEKFNFKNESFEKTGIVLNDVAYINSPEKIYKISDLSADEVYSTPKGFYIWCDMNYDDKLIFIEYNPESKKANFHGFAGSISFALNSMPTGGIAVSDSGYAFIAGDEIYIIGRNNNTVNKFRLNFFPGGNLFYSAGKIFFDKNSEEIYFWENDKIRYSGIKSQFMNSMGTNGKYIFTGNMNGWNAYSFTGNKIFSQDANSPCMIHAISDNIICVSEDCGMLLHNMNRLTESEIIYINGESAFDMIVSVLISNRAIYSLTESGTLAVIDNNKINLKL